MSFTGVRAPSEVVSLLTRKEGQYIVHSTASACNGDSILSSPAGSKDGQMHDLREALNEKELELMELKERHSQLQSHSFQAQGNWESVLVSKDKAIQQLEQALKTKQLSFLPLSEPHKQNQDEGLQSGNGQPESEQRLRLLQAQGADGTATRAYAGTVASRDGARESRSQSPRSQPRKFPSFATEPLNAVPRRTPENPNDAPKATSTSHMGAVASHLPRQESTLPRHTAPPDSLFADIEAAKVALANSGTQPRQQAASCPGNPQHLTQTNSEVPLQRQLALPHPSVDQTLPGSIPDREPERATRPSIDSVVTTMQGGLPSRSNKSPQWNRWQRHPSQQESYNELLGNIRKAKRLLRTYRVDGKDPDMRLWDILETQESLVAGIGTENFPIHNNCYDGYQSPGMDEFSVANDNARKAGIRIEQLQDQNDDLQAHIASLQAENHELRLLAEEHESNVVELQHTRDLLEARLGEGSPGQPTANLQIAQSHEHQDQTSSIQKELQKTQKRLANRDAAAKKYKDGCRALKERVEQLQKVCQKLKERNTELVESAPKAAEQQAEHEKELRNLLTEAQQDVESHRSIAVKAERELRVAQGQVAELQQRLKAAEDNWEEAKARAEVRLDEERQRAARTLRQHRADAEQEAATVSEEAAQALSRAERLRQEASEMEAAAARRVEAANEAARVVEARLSEAREEIARLKRGLEAAEEGAGRDARRIETMQRDVQAEQQHTAAALERLDRAHTRVQQLEAQLSEADEIVARHKEERRSAETETADLHYKLQQAERQCKQESFAMASLQERYDASVTRLRAAEARAIEAEQEIADQAMALKEWEARLQESEHTCADSDRLVQELKAALGHSEAEISTLREAMLQTESLIKKARLEHEQEVEEASSRSAADMESLQRVCNDLQISVERERAGREKAEKCLHEAHLALEKHRSSLEENHGQSLKAASTIQAMKERMQHTQKELEERDATIISLQKNLAQANVNLQQQLAAKDSLMQARSLEAAELAEKDRQLHAAQARLAHVAPLMRRLASGKPRR